MFWDVASCSLGWLWLKWLNDFNKFDLNSTSNFFLQISVLVDKIKRGIF